MQRPLLLIVDGESLRTRGLERALVADGWDLDWTASEQMNIPPLGGGEPNLVLLDPRAHGDSAISMVTDFRGQHPRIPVVILQDGPHAPGSAPLPDGAGILPRNLPEDHWPSFLRGFLTMPVSESKLSAEDLFGDILAEFDTPPPPMVRQPEAPPPAAPIPAPIAPAPSRPGPPALLPNRVPPDRSSPAAPSPMKPMVVQMPISRPKVSQESAKPKPSTTTIQTPLLRTPVIRTTSTPSVPPMRPLPPTIPQRPSTPPVPRSAPPSLPRADIAPTIPSAPMTPPEAHYPTVPDPLVESMDDLAGLEFPQMESEGMGSEELESEALQPEEMAPKREAPSLLLPELFGDLLGPLSVSPDTRPPSKMGNDFTLSGFSGIMDPFDVSPKGPSTEPALEPLSGDGRLSPESLDIEFLNTSITPAPRAHRLPTASRAVQPSLTPDLELKQNDGENPLEEFGNYYLLEKIAVGGMAELFKARQRGVHNFEKIVAIKRILPHLSDNDEFVRMFIDEAKLAAQLTHPNIVQIFDLGKASGFYYIAMEYVDGKDLRSLLRKVREYHLPMPEPIAAYVTMKIAMALDYAHRKRGMNDKELKLVHRDVSPQNVLISSEGAVKLVDFGIAKAATKSTQTMAGALKGKLLYMSPEQALGQSLDNRSDIYSLGLVLFELLTGERCFQADSELGVLEKVRLGKVQDIHTVNPMVSQDLAEILEKSLHKNVDQRYSGARLMERDLKSLLVRHGNEPTDHDLAEYVNTLLKGTKEQLEHLLADHFAVKTLVPESRPPARPLPPKAAEDPPTLPEAIKPLMISLPPPEIGAGEGGKRRRWLIPVILLAVTIIVATIWLLIR